MKMPLTVWTFSSSNPVVPDTWRAYECFAENKEMLYVALKRDYGRTIEQADAMGLIPVEVLTTDLPKDNKRVQDKIHQAQMYGWPKLVYESDNC